MLLSGSIVKIITVRGVTWSAENCKNDPEFLAKLKSHGAYHEMFSKSPSLYFPSCVSLYFDRSCFKNFACADAIVPRVFHPKELMYDSVVHTGEALIAHGLELIADPESFRLKMQFQGQRSVNCVPPHGFEAWEKTGKTIYGMPCWRSILGILRRICRSPLLHFERLRRLTLSTQALI